MNGTQTAGPRSRFVTVLAWLTMAGGALLLPISVISLLMVLAGSHGTQNASLLGGLLVIGGPPAAVATGFGLLQRQRWAYAAVVAMLVLWAASNLVSILRGPTPERTDIAPSGVKTTVLASGVDYPWHVLMIAVSVGVLVKLSTPSVRAELGVSRPAGAASRPESAESMAGSGPAILEVPDELVATDATRDRSRGWRVGHQGRDSMYYEEWHDGAWQRLPISGEMLMGRAHHVIYFASPEAWQQYPEWARHRRDEIIARIESELRAPDYEYDGDVASTTPARSSRSAAAPAALAPPASARTKQSAATPAQMRMLWLAITLVLGLAAGAGWLVTRGLTRGDIWIPAKQAPRQRHVYRAEEPGIFWLSLGVYSVIAAGAAGLGVWGIREGLRLRRE